MMIVIRVDVPKRHAKDIKIKDVIGVTEDGTCWKLRVLNIYVEARLSQKDKR